MVIITSIKGIVNDYTDFMNWYSGIIGLILCWFIVLMVKHGLFPYKEIKRLQKSNPELVQAYEEDFETAEQINYKIWFGSKFIFFRANEFHVLKYDDITSLKLFKKYLNRTKYFELEVQASDKHFDVKIFAGIWQEENAILCAKKVAAQTGAPLTIDL